MRLPIGVRAQRQSAAIRHVVRLSRVLVHVESFHRLEALSCVRVVGQWLLTISFIGVDVVVRAAWREWHIRETTTNGLESVLVHWLQDGSFDRLKWRRRRRFHWRRRDGKKWLRMDKTRSCLAIRGEEWLTCCWVTTTEWLGWWAKNIDSFNVRSCFSSAPISLTFFVHQTQMNIRHVMNSVRFFVGNFLQLLIQAVARQSEFDFAIGHLFEQVSIVTFRLGSFRSRIQWLTERVRAIHAAASIEYIVLNAELARHLFVRRSTLWY